MDKFARFVFFVAVVVVVAYVRQPRPAPALLLPEGSLRIPNLQQPGPALGLSHEWGLGRRPTLLELLQRMEDASAPEFDGRGPIG